MKLKDLNEQQLKTLVNLGYIYLKIIASFDSSKIVDLNNKEDLLNYLENVRTKGIKEALLKD